MQFYRDDHVATVVWVVLDNPMSVSIRSSQSEHRYDKDDYMETRLNADYFYARHNKAISLMKPLLHIETFI